MWSVLILFIIFGAFLVAIFSIAYILIRLNKRILSEMKTAGPGEYPQPAKGM